MLWSHLSAKVIILTEKVKVPSLTDKAKFPLYLVEYQEDFLDCLMHNIMLF